MSCRRRTTAAAPSNTYELAKWAQPHVVVSSQGPPRSLPKTNAYEAVQAPYLTTWPHGAVTIHREKGEFVVETFHTKNRWPLPVARKRAPLSGEP